MSRRRGEQSSVSAPEDESSRKESKVAKIKLYKTLFSNRQTRFAIFPSLLLGLPAVVEYVIWSDTVNTIARGLMDTSYDPMPDIGRQAIWMTILAVAAGIFKFLDSFYWMRAGSALSVKIRRNLFNKMMKSEVTFFDVNPIGGILTLLSEDARVVQDAFGPIKGIQLQNISSFIAAVIATLCFNWKIGCLYVASFLLLGITLPIFSPGIQRHSKLRFEFITKSITIAEEAIANIRTVRGFNREDDEKKRFHEANAKGQRHAKLEDMYLVGLIIVVMIIIWGAIAVLYYYGATMVDDATSDFQIGNLFASFGFLLTGDSCLLALQQSLQSEEKAIQAGTRIIKLSEYQPKIQFEGGNQVEDMKGHIEFRNVSFKYPTRDTYVLKNVSFEVKPENVAALVGHSGSGKSTCVQLLERFYDVTDGMILIDGHNIKDLDPRWLHRKISLVSQEPVLFRASVRDNIKYGARDASEEQMLAAAEISNVRKFVEKFPRGFDELVGEKGSSMSGGQRQRIAIARAVIRDPVILITDEATSALDSESERKVQLALNKVMGNRTCVVVAHRLSTIRHADVIYVFEAGEIKEHGTHDELIAHKGFYYNLVRRQLMHQGSEDL